ALEAVALLPALALLALLARAKRRRALALFGASLAGPRRGPRRLRGLCLVLGLACLGVGLAGPRWGREPGQATAPGRDLVIVLDDSRSMFAESPTRLELAQAALLDLAEALRSRGR